MSRPPLRLARPGQLPAPATGHDSLHVLDEATGQLARHRNPTGSASPPSGCTPWQASSPRPSSSWPRPSTTPATRNSPGPRSASSSTPPPPPSHAPTRTARDQLDNDHPHNAADRAAGRADIVLVAIVPFWLR
jgi:hypothetical protein